MEKIEAVGEYIYKVDGTKHTFEYVYPVYPTIEEAIAAVGGAEVLKTYNRMVKVDVANTSREAARRTNGHSTERVLTPEEKEAKKVARKDDRNLLQMLKDNPDLLAQLKELKG